MTMLTRGKGLLAVVLVCVPAAVGAQQKQGVSEVKTYDLPQTEAGKPGPVVGGPGTGKPATPLSVRTLATRSERMADDKLEQAIATLNELIQTTDEDDPSKPEYYVRLARLYWDKAENFYNKANSNEIFARLRAAQESGDEAAVQAIQEEQNAFLEERKRWQEETANAYMLVVSRYPNFDQLPMVLYLLGYTLVQMDRADQAFPYFARIVREAPESRYVPDALLNIGEFFFNAGRMGDAEKMYGEVASCCADSNAYGLAIYKQAWCYFNMGRHEEAMNRFLDVINYARSDAAKASGYATQLLREAQGNLVMVYSQVGTPENAIKVFRAISPSNYMDLAIRLAESYASQGEFDKSSRLYKKIMAEYKDASDAWRMVEFQRAIVLNAYNLGIKKPVVEETRRLIGLLERFQKEAPATFIGPEMEKAESLVRGIVTNYHKEVALTKEEATMEFTHLLYQEYLRLFPNAPEYPMMVLNYARLLFQLEKYAEAADRFTQIVDMDPKGPAALDAAHDAVSAYYKLLDLSRHKAKSDDAMDTEPKDLPEFESKLVRACERYLAMAKPGAPDLVEARFAAAMVWYQFNHFDKAIEGFRQIIQESPGHENAPDAARLLLSALQLTRNIPGLYQAAEQIQGNPNLLKGDIPGILAKIAEQRDFNRCFEHEQAGNHRTAAECFLDYVRRFPNTPLKDKSLLNAANNFFKARLVERSLEANQQLVNTMPDSPLAARALFYIADTYRRLAVYSEAARIYEIFVAQAPKHELAEEALRYATLFRAGLGEWDLAIKDLRRYMELFPKNPYAAAQAFEIANILEKQGKAALAQKEYEAWLRKYGRSNPDLYLKAHLRIGLTLRTQRQEARALEWFEKTVKAYEELSDEEKGKVTPVGLASAAEAQFYRGEAVLAEMQGIQLKLPEKVLKESIARKLALLKQAMDLLASVEAFGQPNWTIAAWSRRGSGYQELAEAIENSPVPPGLTTDQKLFYREGLSQQAMPIWNASRDSYRRCVELAQQLRWYNRYSEEAEEQLLKLDPGFRTLPDMRPQPGFYSLNETRGTLKPDQEGENAPKWTDEGVRDRIRKAAARSDANAGAWYNLGLLRFWDRDIAGAREAFQKALALDPKMDDAMGQLGRLALLEGNLEAAQAQFARAVEIDPANAVANSFYAARALRDRKYPEAISLARKALVADPDSMDAYQVLAASYLEMGLPDLGILVARNALSLSPDDGPIQNILGLIFLKKGEVRQAVQLFQKSVRDDPRRFNSRMNFGAVTLAYKDFETALDQFSEALKLEPSSYEASLGRAVALRGLNKGEEALALYRQIDRDGQNPDVQFNLCVLYQMTLQKNEEAQRACETFLRIAPPQHPRRKEATRRLESIRATIEALREPPPAAPAPAPEGTP
ncbi:tetratricopeptide repeat protein [Myxococcota bacterium]|nr:tetratricopeptide repeat protein [Myxococcota bacterium]